MADELTIWEPEKFDGSDLLPTHLMGGDVTTVPTVGRENIEPEDIVLPQLALLHGQSDAVLQGEDDAKPGHFYMTSNGRVWKPPVRALAIFHHRSAAMFVRDDADYDGLKNCISRDAVTGNEYGACDECRRCFDWRGRTPPLGQWAHNFTVLTPDGPCIIRVPMTNKWNRNAMNSFITNWQFSPHNLWSFPLCVRAMPRVNREQKPYFSVDIRWLLGQAVPERVQAEAQAMHARISASHEAGKFKSDAPDGVSPDDHVPFN